MKNPLARKVIIKTTVTLPNAETSRIKSNSHCGPIGNEILPGVLNDKRIEFSTLVNLFEITAKVSSRSKIIAVINAIISGSIRLILLKEFRYSKSLFKK